ncbi:MAG: septum formation protein Maf [Myxococcaceae bacterium]|nr:septum formation protein Maf [Myxococcaceae bacterium]
MTTTTPNQPELVLASTSPARRALMQSLGIPWRAEAPGVDEHVPPGTGVREAVQLLARRKAEAVARRAPGALVIGSDQLVCLDGEALGKPQNRDQARAQLRRLSGRRHEIVTGLCLIGPTVPHGADVEVDVATLELYALTEDELERYLDTGEWQGCAGGYRVEGRGQALFRNIEGDRTGVMGLPMVRLIRMLRGAGVVFF